MDFSLSSLIIIKPLSKLNNLSGLVLSAFSKGAQQQNQEQFSDSLDVSTQAHCFKSILSVIEAQIIPSLIDAHSSKEAQQKLSSSQSKEFSSDEIEQFCVACLGNDSDKPLEFVTAFLDQGISMQSIFMDLITPSARWLGEQWEEDKIDFTAVTEGLMRMHQVTRNLGYRNQDSPQVSGEVKRILLACAPGSMHILGLSIVSELFRNDGWHVVMEMASSEKDLIHTLRREWFDVVGLSVALVEQLPGLPSLVKTIRAEALNPNTQLILGGRAVLLDEDLLTKTGADGMSADAPEAIMIANQLLSTKK